MTVPGSARPRPRLAVTTLTATLGTPVFFGTDEAGQLDADHRHEQQGGKDRQYPAPR